MSINKYKCDFDLYLLAIKQAFESGAFSKDDCAILMGFFQQGLLYRSILDQEILCAGAVLKGIGEFCTLMESNLPAPDMSGEMKAPLDLIPGTAELPVSQELPPGTMRRADQLFRLVVVDLLAIFQVAILSLSRHLSASKDLTSTEVVNTHYVIGMAELSAVNIGDLMEKGFHFGDSNHEHIQQSLMGLMRFAAALKQSSEELVFDL